MSTCGQQSPDLVDWDRNLGKKWYQISSKKLSPFLVGHLLDFWPHNNNLLFVPQGFEKLHRSSPLRLIARDIGKKLFYRVLGNVTQKKKSPYGDLCNITITFGRPDCQMSRRAHHDARQGKHRSGRPRSAAAGRTGGMATSL